MNFKMYDIFGICINKNNKYNNEFIIIEIDENYLDLILSPISQYNGTFIYKYECSDEFRDYCSDVGINIDDYIKLGDYIIYDMNEIKIILGHKKVVHVTNHYTLIDTIGQLYIWKPHTINNNFTNLGVICMSQTNEIPNDPIGMIPMKYIKIFESNYNDLFQNDFCVLGSKTNGKRKLITLHMINNKNTDYTSQDNTLKNDIKWISKYKNDTVYLKCAVNPWYINKKMVINQEDIINNNFFKKNKLAKISKHIKNKNKKLNRLNKLNGLNRLKINSEIESKNIESSTYVIVVLFVIIILLFVYNKYQKKN